MRRQLVLILTVLALAAACSDDDGGSLFGSTTATVSQTVGNVVVEAAGRAWELPAAVCLRAGGDAEVVLAASQEEASRVRSLVGNLVSGWPTTTYSLSFDYPTYEEDLHAAGVAALVLARLVGEQAALEEAWVQWEQAFANPEGGWGGPEEISRRVDRWRAEAETLAGAIADYCATG
ncbi:MAG TPA: hypothetical protein VLS92_00510 [Acidimicrobiia bacterium]|nr:hypothetical protein [Acidimicrobiia bacterium]